MPCACDQCLEYARALGLPGTAPSKAAIHKAYRAAAKRWHPDQFENDPGQKLEAEEHFKLVQIVYRELTEHCEHPAQLPPASIFVKAAPPPPFSFGDAPGCFTGPHFPADVERIIADHLGPGYAALSIVDLARPGSPGGSFSQFLLLANHAIIVRDRLGMVSLLWYSELGEIKLDGRRRNGKLGLLQKLAENLSGPQPNYSLRIDRRNGTHFYTLAGQVDDSAMKVIYNFLLRQKHQPQA